MAEVTPMFPDEVDRIFEMCRSCCNCMHSMEQKVQGPFTVYAPYNWNDETYNMCRLTNESVTKNGSCAAFTY